MTIKKFANEHHLSQSKIKKMAPYIEGAKQCEFCKRWNLPDDARPIYIPDNRCYKNGYKEYCYVIDAISLNFHIHPILSKLPEDRCHTIVRELKTCGTITLIEGRQENSLNPQDYILSTSYLAWKEQKASEKTKLVIDMLKTVQSIGNSVANIVQIAYGA